MNAINAFPTGTVTFLFTDIEGSTELWEKHPEVMETALARHDALLRNAIQTHGGVVFKTIGDAFCAAFPNAPNALAAAADAQIALLAGETNSGGSVSLRVRMAVHTGLAQARDHDYFGPPLNRVARLMASGHGGQTLLSAACFELVRDHLPPSVGLLDLGLHRLKDLERPETVYQVTYPGLPDLPADFPPLKSLDNTPNNLPQQVTSFIGRGKAIADVTALLTKTRLLTLTGSGGSGKTRLSLQVAADVLDAYPDGAWLVELAPLSDPALVPQTVAQVLSIKEQAGQTIVQTLTSGIKNKHLLLVLDNCEHLLSACAELVAALLRACPNVRVLATSREPLGIAGETTYRVPSLSLPSSQEGKKATVDNLSQFEAVRLFIDRAQAVKPDFAVTNANAPALAQLCYRLDGIPLALELAAARVRSLPVEQINDKLDSRFRLLTGGDRNALPRQQTLRALVDWSYDLLTETEKTLFARLSVFSGGWMLAAAEAVCGWEPIEDWEVLDVLTSLSDKSLIIADADAGETRYRLLETLKQYGAEKRDASGDKTNLQTRYQNYFLVLAEEAKPQLTGPEQVAWLNRLETEYDNLRAVLDNCAARGAEGEKDGLRLVGALWLFWEVRGHLLEGREQIARALRVQESSGTPQVREVTPEAQRLRANALIGAGFLAIAQGDWKVVRPLLDESLFLSRAANDTNAIAQALLCLGQAASMQNDFSTARAYFEEGLALSRQSGDKHGIGVSLNHLGELAFDEGDYPAAQKWHAESIALRRTLGHKRGIASSLMKLGVLAGTQKDFAASEAFFEESVAFYRELGSFQGEAAVLGNWGYGAFTQSDYQRARRYYEASLVLSRQINDKQGIMESLNDLAFLCVSEENPYQAIVLLGAESALRETLDIVLSPRLQVKQAEQLEKARTVLSSSHAGSETFSAAWEQGRALSWEQAADYALNKTAPPAA